MINEEATKTKYGYTSNDIQKWGQKILILNCNICGILYEKPSVKVFMARKNSKSEVDLCSNIECIKKKRENTMLEKYGVINASLNKELNDKKKQTCIKNYGTEWIFERKDLMKNCMLEKYGVKNAFQSELCKNKIKKTNLKKYGKEYFSQTDEYKKKVKDTNLIKYDKEYYTQTKEYIDRIKKTNLKKYGKEYFSQTDEYKKKVKDTMLKKYGVDNYSKTLEHKINFKKISLEKMYYKLINEDRLKNLYKPLFDIKDYNGVQEKYKFECLKCGNIFLDDIDNGSLPECKICYPSEVVVSKIEIEIEKFLFSIGEKIIRRNRKCLNNIYELDFFIPSKNIAIEFNGNYWHSQVGGKKSKMYHIDKLKMCEEKGIHLIQIFEDEWIYQKDIVKNRMLSILKIEKDKKIYARLCNIKILSSEESKIFLNKYHIQGYIPSNINIGLFYKEEIISIMNFGKLRLALGNKKSKENEYEMIRYCTNKIVIGGANKLLSYFIKTYNPSKIISYADRRWTYYKDNLYEKIGFSKISNGSPNYWYINKKKYLQRFHRFTFRKDRLKDILKEFNPNLTEWENMQLNGYDRIWDCGSLKYEWTNKETNILL